MAAINARHWTRLKHAQVIKGVAREEIRQKRGIRNNKRRKVCLVKKSCFTKTNLGTIIVYAHITQM